MNTITIICSDPIEEKLLHYITAELPQPDGEVVLLDAVLMDRIPEFPGNKIIVFTASADPRYLSAAREAGADGFWYLQSPAEELARVLRGESAFPPKSPVVQLGSAKSSDLTRRELEVLREMVAGKTDAQIGETLNMSVPTVKHHIQSLREKTGYANRTQIAVGARDCGLIIPAKATPQS